MLTVPESQAFESLKFILKNEYVNLTIFIILNVKACIFKVKNNHEPIVMRVTLK